MQTNCWGALDKGILLEDLDALAGNVRWIKWGAGLLLLRVALVYLPNCKCAPSLSPVLLPRKMHLSETGIVAPRSNGQWP